MESFYTRLQHAESLADVWHVATPYFRSHGFHAWCYFALKDGPYPDLVKEEGFPEAWVTKYTSEQLERIDPIIPFSAGSGQSVRWGQIGEKIKLSRPQKEFVSALEKSEMTDGVTVPAYGPRGHHAIFGLGMIQSDDAFDNLHLMKSAAQALHGKVIELTSDADYPSLLSPREIEVLCWIARGKSNPDIATILNISADTISSHVRRIFSKLDVSDRTSAAVKGVRMGMAC